MRVQCVYLSANRFPTTRENGIRTCTFVFRLPTPPEKRNSRFHFRFPFSVFLLHWKWNSNLYFRFSFSHYFGKENCNCHLRFLISRFRKTLKTEFELRFSFFVAVFLLLSYFTIPGRMLVFSAFKRKLKQILFSILASQDSCIDLSEIVQHVKSWQYFSCLLYFH